MSWKLYIVYYYTYYTNYTSDFVSKQYKPSLQLLRTGNSVILEYIQ